MAKVTGPLFSMSASGALGDAIVFSTWKGKEYVRAYQIPSNPKTVKQVNLRNAFTMTIAYWHAQTDPQKLIWKAFAEGTGKSGFNQFVERALKAYITDHGTSVVVTAVAVAGDPPSDVWTWTPAV